MANLGIIGADPSEPPSHEAVISLANRLLSQFNISTKIESIDDISAALFVILYECLFSSRLPGIIRQPKCKEDEIHNCHVVIDVLSTDVVRDNLSHIRAEDVVSGDITAISNLLDIFSYLLEYVINKIDSDVPTDLEDTISLSTVEPDGLDIRSATTKSSQEAKHTKGTLPNQQWSKFSLVPSNRTNNNGSKALAKTVALGPSDGKKSTSSLERNENRLVISHEDFYTMSYEGLSDSFSNRPPSPIRPDHSLSLLGQKSIDSEFELEKLERKLQGDKKPASPKLAWEEKKGEQRITRSPLADPQSPLAVRELSGAAVTPALMSTEPLIPRNSSNAFSASMPAGGGRIEKKSSDPLRSTVGPINHRSEKSTPEKSTQQEKKKSPTVAGLSSSYNDLRHLVEKTAALTRVALENSPVRSRTQRDLDITDVSEQRPRPYISSEGAKLAKELNALGLHPSGREEKQPPPKVNKRVAFLTSNTQHSYLDRGDDRRPLESISNRECSRANNSKDGYSSDRESDLGQQEPDNRARTEKSLKPKGKPAMAGTKIKPKKATTKKQSMASHLAKNRQPEFGAVQVTLKAEDKEMRRKQDILRRMYDEEMEELTEEVQDMLAQDREKSKETYDEYIRRCLEGAPKKKVSEKMKKSAVPSTLKKRKLTSTSKPVARPVVSKLKEPKAKKLTVVASEDELLPTLLEEFPHLHLSEHTWHELWRKGLHQIESLTNSYKESQHKKCRAQNQLEEAATRYELLAEIMKKQVQHTQRMRDITQRKQQQLQVRNKLHEQRMQSARARRYYNEYQVRARGKQLKKKTKEELVFRELFKDALDIQKERIKDIRKYALDQRKEQESKRQDEIDSMHNFYQSQFDLLSEKLSKERMETEIRDTAQQQMMERLKRELRKKMESEILLYQDQMLRDEDDTHFRQVDADRIRQQLHLAQFSTQI